MSTQQQYDGMTAELYQAVTALVDDRMKEIRVVRQDFDRLVEAQARTGEQLTHLGATVERLAEAQVRTEARVEELAAAQARTEEQLTRLEATVERLAQVLERLTSLVERLDSQMADLRGWQLELRYQERAMAYFGPLLRKARIVPFPEIEDELEARLPWGEFMDLLQLDLLVHGQPRKHPELQAIWLAVEVSGVIDWRDITRALQRANALQRAGYVAIPTVAGTKATDWVKEMAFDEKVLLLEDGHAYFWEEALAKVLGSCQV